MILEDIVWRSYEDKLKTVIPGTKTDEEGWLVEGDLRWVPLSSRD